MREEEIEKELKEQRELLQKAYESTEKTRKYFLWTLILSVVLFVVPLIILIAILPWFLNTLTGGLMGI